MAALLLFLIDEILQKGYDFVSRGNDNRVSRENELADVKRQLVGRENELDDVKRQLVSKKNELDEQLRLAHGMIEQEREQHNLYRIGINRQWNLFTSGLLGISDIRWRLWTHYNIMLPWQQLITC